MKKARRRPAEDTLLEKAREVIEHPPGFEELLREYTSLAASFGELSRKFLKTLSISDGYQRQIKDLATELARADSKLSQLREVALPICVYCRKIRSDDDYWQRLETFLTHYADVKFSQGICPECVQHTFQALGSAASPSPAQEALLPALPAKPRKAKASAQAGTEAERRDPDAEALLALSERLAGEDPEAAAAARLGAQRFEKMSRRFAKTLSISDSYQFQLRDLNTRLELLARTDLLTGLANRWEMANRLRVEQNRLERHGSIFTLILADIDLFKTINDTFGHQAGDQALRQIARLFRDSLRAEDLCGRWGGEEFLILLPETGLAEGEQVALKLKRLLAEMPVRFDKKTLAVTASFGVSQSDRGKDVDEIIRQVDRAMYQAKQAGRNRVVAL